MIEHLRSGLNNYDQAKTLLIRFPNGVRDEKKWVPTTKSRLIHFTTPDFPLSIMIEKLDAGETVTSPDGTIFTVI